MKILNLLAHNLTPNQIAQLAGHQIVSLKEIAPELVEFCKQCPDDRALLRANARKLAHICREFDRVIAPVGSPAFMAEFFAIIGENKLRVKISNFIFAHSVRDSVEVEVNGVVEKKVVFKHVRFF